MIAGRRQREAGYSGMTMGEKFIVRTKATPADYGVRRCDGAC